MSTLLHIRSASTNDVGTLAALNAHVQDVHVRGRPSLFRTTVPNAVAEWFRARLGEPGVQAWIVEEDGAAIGYALVIPRVRQASPFTVSEHVHEIDQIGVVPAARGRGVARALVDHIRRQARDAGVEGVVLTAWMFNEDARAVFDRLGFQAEVLRYRLRD